MSVSLESGSATSKSLAWHSAETAASVAVATASIEDTGAELRYIPNLPPPGVSRAMKFMLVAAAASACLSATAPAPPVWRRRDEGTATSAKQDLQSELEQIAGELASALWSSRDEVFEDGIDGRLWRWLGEHFSARRSDFAEALAALLESGHVPPEPSAMALRWLGDRPARESMATQRWLLERSLFSIEAVIRDGAVIALQNLGDAGAVNALEAAARRESIEVLRDEMEAASRELVLARAVPPS